jgi:hypothetical protein
MKITISWDIMTFSLDVHKRVEGMYSFHRQGEKYGKQDSNSACC